MAEIKRFSDLPSSFQVLVRTCQEISYGTIQCLLVREGLPLFDPAPVIFRDIKLDSDEGPRRELGRNDFVLSGEIVRQRERADDAAHPPSVW